MSGASPPGDHPTTIEIFTRVWLHELSRAARTHITLATIPDEQLDRLATLGIDLVYLMGVWTLGHEGPRISREQPEWRAEYDHALPGWTQDDIAGSPFAVARYEVDPSFGGDRALADLRERLGRRHMGLVLDYVPNHVAPDHIWVSEAPELFMRGAGGRILPGRDPYFPPWPDTAQLDFRLRATRQASIAALRSIAERCDGVRCDMAMLVLDAPFRRTWAGTPRASAGDEARGEFWAEAIDTLRTHRPDFLFIAEAYWDLEWRLQMLGFDYTYDKSLYDRLIHGSPESIRAHLTATLDYQRRSVRFLENHDEPRLASVLPADRRKAAMVLAATVPGMRFFHEGQMEGRQIRASLHLRRRAEEPVDPECQQFYESLFAALRRPALHRGSFATLSARSAGGHGAAWKAFVAHRWDSREGAIVVVINFGPGRGQCRITLDIAGTAGKTVRLTDLLTGEVYLRDGDELLDPIRGLFVDLPAYGVHLLEIGRG